jgi:hypothetical protein
LESGLCSGEHVWTVNTLDDLFSHDFWDQDDVWDVDPITDIGNDAAAGIARVGTEAALVANTLGLSQAATAGKVVNAVDLAGNVVARLQGAGNAAQNDHMSCDEGPLMSSSRLDDL